MLQNLLKLTVIIGEDELRSSSATLKDMTAGQQERVSLAELECVLSAKLDDLQRRQVRDNSGSTGHVQSPSSSAAKAT